MNNTNSSEGHIEFQKFYIKQTPWNDRKIICLMLERQSKLFLYLKKIQYFIHIPQVPL